MLKLLCNFKRSTLILSIFCLVFFSACSHIPRKLIFNDYAVIRIKQGDSFTALAEEYLKDPSLGWMISEFNNVAELSPGQELVIPLQPFRKGGLKATGYQTIPILSYNRFSKNWAGRRTVTQPAFNAQMKYLKENGYHPITLKQLLNFLNFKGQVPEKAVIITIDDGWASVHKIAYPILKKYDIPAVLFLYTDLIGTQNAMTWEQIQEMHENGIDIQCKAKTRRNLAEQKEDETFKDYVEAIENEITLSSMAIEKKLNKKCRCLAYPLGDHNHLVRFLLKKQNFKAGFTLKNGENPFFVNKYKIHRSIIFGKDDLEKFKNNLIVFHKTDLK